MATFELNASSSDGSAKALAKAIIMASKISRDASLEFTPDKLKLCAKTEFFLVRFDFRKDFFTNYECNTRHKCYVNLKALMMPFKSNVLNADKEAGLKSLVKIKCFVEDNINNQIIFKIGGDPPAAVLTHKISINDMDPDRMLNLDQTNRRIINRLVEMAPKQSKKERFLLSAFNNFAPDIDQVSIGAFKKEVKFIGSTSTLLSSTNTTSEFRHDTDDFSQYTVKEEVSITVPLRFLKLFLSFVENNRIQSLATYILEGQGLPAHFIYDCHLYKGQFMSSTPYSYVPKDDDDILPIEMNPDESFIADENIIPGPDYDIENDESYANLRNQYHLDESDDSNDGYNENRSDEEDEQDHELLDGDLEGLNRTTGSKSMNFNDSIFSGTESIRGEMTGREFDPDKIRELVNIDEDPDDYENVVIHYSSDEEE